MNINIYFENNLIVAMIKAIRPSIKTIRGIIISKQLMVFHSLVKSLPQCLQTIASSLTFSAQYGHFFIVNLLLAEYLLINVNIK